MPGKVTLTSQDQQSIGEFLKIIFKKNLKLKDVDVEVIKQSKIVSQMMSDLGEDTQMDALPIPNVNSAILKKVIEWCK